MRLKAIMMTLICALAISCSQKEEFVLSTDSTFLTATVESSDASTKVGFTSGNADFFWTKGDVIGVTTSATSTFMAMGLQGEGGNSSGVFAGTISGQPNGYAIYPYGELGRHSLNGTELTYKLPAEYTYTSTDASYAKVDGNSHNAPMWGAISNGSVAFKHLGGVFAVQVNDLPANTQGLKLVLTASKQISGTFTADLSAETPVMVSGEATSEADKKVTINFATVEGQTTGHFYIPLPTGAVGNLLLTVTDSESNLLAMGAWDNKTVTRRMIARATIGEQTVEGAEGQVKSVGSVEDITNTILSTTEENLVVNVTSQLTGTDNVIDIPASLATETTTFSFASIANNAEIEINAVENAYAGQIIIEIPADATLPVVNANIPNGEVYIKQGTVTTLVVASADNTTIIGAGATVGTLEVLKGNVRILNGGNVTTIKRSTGNTDAVTNVIFEGELPSSANADPKIIYVSAAEWDLRKAAEKGGTYTMTSDVTLSGTLVIEKPLVLNGGGFTLTSTMSGTSGRAINVKGANGVTIEDLIINASGERAINIIQNATNVIINNVTAKANNYTVNVANSAPNAVVEIKNSNLTGLNVVNVAAPGADVVVNSTIINCKDDNSDEGYSTLCLNKDAKNGKIVATGVTINITGSGSDDTVKATNSAEGGIITIDGSEDEVDVDVAFVAYGNYYYGFTTIKGAIEKAKAGETVTLIRNVSASEVVAVNKAITFDGNGKTLTSTAGRAINVSGANGVTIKNLTINASGERAINVIQNATNIIVDNVTATAANYTVNVASSAPDAVINITNSDLTGLNVINVGSNGAKITVGKTKITCNDQNALESYGAISINKDAVNAKVVATDVTLDIKGDSKQVSIGAAGGSVSINGQEVPQNVVAIIEYPGPYYYSFGTLKGAIAKAKDGETVKLIQNITLDSKVEIEKNITINLNGFEVTHSTSGNASYGDIFNVIGNGKLTIEDNGVVVVIMGGNA